MPLYFVGQDGHLRVLRRSASSWGLWGVRTMVFECRSRKRLPSWKEREPRPKSSKWVIRALLETFWEARAELQT